MKLKRVGFFRELRHGIPDGPELKQSISESPQEDEERIVEYLKNGILLVGTFCVARDVLAPEKHAASPHVFTDGVWVWPGDLSYYVATYHARLPEEFVLHAKEMNWAVPPKESLCLDQLDVALRRS